jgi:hypothetical protein
MKKLPEKKILGLILDKRDSSIYFISTISHPSTHRNKRIQRGSACPMDFDTVRVWDGIFEGAGLVLGYTGMVDATGLILLFIILRYPHPDYDHLLFASDFFHPRPGLLIKGR